MKTNRIKRIQILLLLLLMVTGYGMAQTPSYPQTLTFREYISEVARNNLDYLAEKYNIQIADAEVKAQKVLPDPELTFEGGEDYFTLELGYTLELGKRNARVRLAKSEAQFERLGLELYFQELRADAAEAFLDAIIQREMLEVKRSSYEYMLQLSHSDSIRFILGEITENDARQSKLEAATLLNEVYQQEADYKASLALLNLFMGLSTPIPEVLVGDWNKFEREYYLADLLATGVNKRLDLAAANKNVEIAYNQLKLIKAERRTDIDLMVGYERDWDGFLPKGNMVKAGITIPLKFSNTNKGEVRAGRFLKEKAEMEQRSMELQIQTEISQAYFYYEGAKKQVRQFESGLIEDSQKVLEGTVYAYQRGETNILEVLIAQRSYNEIREEYLETIKEYVSTLINLEKSCGIWDIEF